MSHQPALFESAPQDDPAVQDALRSVAIRLPWNVDQSRTFSSWRGTVPECWYEWRDAGVITLDVDGGTWTAAWASQQMLVLALEALKDDHSWGWSARQHLKKVTA